MNISDVTSHVMQITRIDAPPAPSTPESRGLEATRAAESAQRAEAALETKAQQQSEPAEKEDINAVINRMNDFVQSAQRNLSFSIDEESGHDIVKVIDVETEEVVRQIPSEEFLKISKSMGSMNGVLFKDQV